MKTLLGLFVLAMVLVMTNISFAAPKLVIYRYQGIDVKSLPADLILGSNVPIDPWIINQTNWPQGRVAFIVHGFPFFDEYMGRKYLAILAQHLQQFKRPDGAPAYDAVYVVEYPKDFHIFVTAAALADTVHGRCSDWPKEMKIDVFAHSLGGLESRTAIECPEAILGTKNMSDRVAHLVMMGTPNNGFPTKEVDIFRKYLNGDSPEVRDMDYGDIFIKGCLNVTNAAKPKVDCDYYAVVGLCSYKPKKFLDGKIGVLANVIKDLKDSLADVHDGLVNRDSAGYDLSAFCRSYKKKELDVNHDYINSDPQVLSQIDQWIAEDHWFGDLPVTPAVQPKITKFTGGVPILLGKNKEEVVKTFGPPYSANSYDYGTLQYRPQKSYYDKMPLWAYTFQFEVTTGLSHDRHGSRDIIFDQNGKVSYTDYEFGSYGNDSGLRLWQVAPKELYSREPDCIGRIGAYGFANLVVIWRVNGQTFCALMLIDQAFDKYMGRDKNNMPETKYRLSKVGQDFVHQGVVLAFMCINSQPDLFSTSIMKTNDGIRAGEVTAGQPLNHQFYFWRLD